jgi:hypothetical protein
MSRSPLDQYLHDFGDALTAATAEYRRTPSRSPARRTLILVALVLVAGIATALAATGVLTGAPVKRPFDGERVQPTQGTGAPIVATARRAALAVDDPAGGLPWGMRIVRTTRRAGCVQIGRLHNGQLGVLGRDGAFGNDGLFHPMGPEVISRTDCQPLDAAGKLYIAVAWRGMPASAWPIGCRPVVNPLYGPRDRPQCPAADERTIYYGTLGPSAVAVRYRTPDGQTGTARTSGHEGAYLVVLAAGSSRRSTGSFTSSASPGTGLLGVRYRDGHTCAIPNPRRLGGAKPCPMVGFALASRIPAAQLRLRSPVQASFGDHPQRPEVPNSHGPVAPEWVLTVAFRSPVATRKASDYYVLFIRPTWGHIRQCGFGGIGGGISQDVQAGQRVRQQFFISTRCHGTLTGTIRFHQRTADPRDNGVGFLGARGDTLVGRFKATIPKR